LTQLLQIAARISLIAIKEGCLERMILFGEDSLRNAVRNFLEHYHLERNHQGLGTGAGRIALRGCPRDCTPTILFLRLVGRSSFSTSEFAALVTSLSLSARRLRHPRQFFSTLPISQTLIAEAKKAVFMPRRVGLGFVRFQTTAVIK
jgi:hypothetical protein